MLFSDSRSAVLLAASLVGIVGTSAARGQTVVNDPVPTVSKGAITVPVMKFAQLPSGTTPVAGGGAIPRLQGITPALDGSGRYFVHDTRGIIYSIPAGGGTNTSTPYLNLNSVAAANFNGTLGNEAGLAGFAFHPDFNRPGTAGYGKFYTSYTAVRNTGPVNYNASDNGSNDGVVREWTATDPTAATFSGTSREVFRVGDFASNHNINSVAFNPNLRPGDADYGNLYVGYGDGGGGDDPRNYGQNKSEPLGSIVRINPLQSGTSRYTVPADNPFVGQGGSAPEIWAYGLRNPQQFSWDKGGTGRMYIGDIGQTKVEEINLGVKGANYGWQLREGTFATAESFGLTNNNVYALPAGDATNNFTYPVAQYDHQDGQAVGGGFVYRGTLIPLLVGKYLFTDFAQGKIFYLDEATLALGQQQAIQELRLTFGGVEQSLAAFLNNGRPDARLGQDLNGELFFVTKADGAVYALVPEPTSLGLLGLGALALLRRRRN